MSRRIVRVEAGVLSIGALACSRTDQSVSAPTIAEQSVAASGLPVAAGVHVAALPGLDGPTATPAAINDFGEVVGSYVNANGTTTAFKWQGSRGLVTFPPFGPNAGAVNNHGDVLLQSLGAQLGIWDWYGHVRALRLLSTYTNNTADAPFCGLGGINDRDVVVGYCMVGASPNFRQLATVWTPFGTPDVLLTGGPGTEINGIASAVSNTGYVVGTDSIRHSGFVWTGEGKAMYLPYPGGSTATAVNDSGWVAGTVSSVDSAAVWLHGDSLMVLPVHVFVTVSGISNAGEVVGSSSAPCRSPGSGRRRTARNGCRHSKAARREHKKPRRRTGSINSTRLSAACWRRRAPSTRSSGRSRVSEVSATWPGPSGHRGWS